jgi:hypothetical protein
MAHWITLTTQTVANHQVDLPPTVPDSLEQIEHTVADSTRGRHMLQKSPGQAHAAPITLGQAIYDLLQKTGIFQSDLAEVKATVKALSDRIVKVDTNRPIAVIRGDIKRLENRVEDVLSIVLNQHSQIPDIPEPQFEAFSCLQLFKVLDELTLDHSPSQHKAEFDHCRKALETRCMQWVPEDQRARIIEAFDRVARPFETADARHDIGKKERSQRYQEIQTLRLKFMNYCAIPKPGSTEKGSAETVSDA